MHRYIKEKFYAISSPKFCEELEGIILIIMRDLYGLKTSNGFKTSKASIDVRP